jgi:peptidoglycan/xylan/chitin deacetylase (PgdA/CDA1 family)
MMLASSDNSSVRSGAIASDRLRNCAVWGASRAALALHTAFRRARTRGFGILMYHRVAQCSAGLAPPTYSVSPEQLHTQLAGLIARGYQPWPLAKALDVYQAGDTVPANAVVVTFDDGYENNLTAALPVLRELGVPATIFLATAFLDSADPFPSDDWSLAGSTRVPTDSWRPLTSRQCEELLASGLIELGAHTHTHGFFAGRGETFREDLGQCLDVLRARFGIQQPSFAFPFGITTPELVQVARQSGVSCALTTRFACVTPGTDPFQWGRFNVVGSDSPAILAAKLAGWYEPVAGSIRSIKRPLARLLGRGQSAETVASAATDFDAAVHLSSELEEVGQR